MSISYKEKYCIHWNFNCNLFVKFSTIPRIVTKIRINSNFYWIKLLNYCKECYKISQQFHKRIIESGCSPLYYIQSKSNNHFM